MRRPFHPVPTLTSFVFRSRCAHDAQRPAARQRLLPLQPVPDRDAEHGRDRPRQAGPAGARRAHVSAPQRGQVPAGGARAVRAEERRQAGARLDRAAEGARRAGGAITLVLSYSSHLNFTYLFGPP